MDRIFYKLECYLKDKIPVTRSGFIKIGLIGLAGMLSKNVFLKYVFAKESVSNGRIKKKIKGSYDLVVAEGNNSFQNTVKAVEKMGGMKKFVPKGGVVVVKPNIGWDRNPAQAANTDPGVVAALVQLCFEAGAKRVNVFDITCNNEKLCYENSGIAKAAKAKGANVYYADTWNVLKARFPYESPMEDWPILRDAIECDAFINVPVLKHHGLTGLTLSMKNLMGVCGAKRGSMHVNIGRKLVDLTDFISPELTVIDATRVLTKHGPTGGSVEDVVTMNQVIVGTDSTLIDAFACSLVKKDPVSIPNIEVAMRRKFGSSDISKANIARIKV